MSCFESLSKTHWACLPEALEGFEDKLSMMMKSWSYRVLTWKWSKLINQIKIEQEGSVSCFESLSKTHWACLPEALEGFEDKLSMMMKSWSYRVLTWKWSKLIKNKQKLVFNRLNTRSNKFQKPVWVRSALLKTGFARTCVGWLEDLRLVRGI